MSKQKPGENEERGPEEGSGLPQEEPQLVALPDDSFVMEAILHQSIKAGQALRLRKPAPSPPEKPAKKWGPLVSRWLVIAGLCSVSMFLVFESLLWLTEETSDSEERSSGTNNTASRPSTKAAPSLVLPPNSSAVKSATLSPDARYLLSSDGSHSLKVWDLATGRELRFSRSDTDIHGGTFSPDGRYLLTSSQGTISLRDTDSGEQIGTFVVSDAGMTVESMSMPPDGQHILANYSDGTVRVWEVASGREVSTFSIRPDEETSSATTPSEIAFSPDGDLALSVPEIPGSPIRIWDTATGKTIRTLASKTRQLVSALTVSPNGRYALSGSQDGEIRVWDVASGKGMRTLKGHSGQITSMAFKGNGRYALSGALDGLVKMWDLSKGKVVRTFKGHQAGITSVSFNPNGRHVLSGSEDKTAKLWDIKTGDLELTWTHLDQGDWAAVTPEGFFDGSPRGIQLVHYEKDGQSIPLEALFDRYYTPKLASRVIEDQLEKKPATDIRKGLSLPPQISITSPKPGESFQTPTIDVTVVAQDQGGGIEDIRLYHNGKLVGTETRGLKRKSSRQEGQTRTFAVQLLPGKNALQAMALNQERTQAKSNEVRVFLAEAEANSTLLVLSIGIDEYQNPGYSLNYAHRDAEAMASALRQGGEQIFKEIEIFTLFDREANRRRLVETLSEIQSKAQPEDVFVLFYAGHGVMSEGVSAPSDFFLALSGVTRLFGHDSLLAEEGFSAQELKEACTEISARKQLLILDACQSGGAVESFALRGAAQQKAIRQLQRSAGIALLVSSGTEQFAAEVEILGHGVFTHVLLQALRGDADGSPEDGKVTTGELGSFVEDIVPEVCLQHRLQPQYPNAYTQGQNFPIGISAMAAVPSSFPPPENGSR